MILSYLESIRYVGHLWPVALLRLALGYTYLSSAIYELQEGYLDLDHIGPYLLPDSSSIYFPGFYCQFFKHFIQLYPLQATYALLSIQIVIGCSFILGFGVRITALLGLLLCLHLYAFFDFPISSGQGQMFSIHLLFFLLSAGRPLGLDYYFYKSRHGLLW